MKLPAGYVAGIGVQKATAYGGLGQRLMERMGWSKGQGLGKEKHGMKEAIQVKKKEDTLGVGANAAWNWEQKYWEDAYNSAIQNINHETSSSSSSSSGSDSSNSDSDADAARRSGKRARKATPHMAPGATAADAPRSLTVNRDGTLATASEAELRIAAELAKDPWGRWGGRAGKMARIRAQEQEEANRARAKLGLPPLPVATALPPASGDGSSSSSTSDEDSDSDGPNTRGRRGAEARRGREKVEEKRAKKGKAKRKKEKEEHAEAGVNSVLDSAAPAKPAPTRVVVVLGSEAAVAARLKMFATFKPTPATGWWGAKMFASAGLLESLEDEAAGEQRLTEAAGRQTADEAAGRVALGGAAAVAAGQRRGFTEDDQTALYKRAHDFQRVGRRGLGKGEIKVGGAKWEGTKKTFGEDDDEEEGGGKEKEERQQKQDRMNGVVGRGRKKDGEKEVEEEGGREMKRKTIEKKEKKGKEEGTSEADRGTCGAAAVSVEKGADKKEKKKERRRQRQEQEQSEKGAAEGKQQQGAAEEGKAAPRKAKRRKGNNEDTAAAASSLPASDLPQQLQQQQQEEDELLAVGGAAAAAAASTPTVGGVPKPRWLKLARMVLKKSAERRLKLRKVVAELVLHAEEQHRNHSRHHNHHHQHPHSGIEQGDEGKEGNGKKKKMTKENKVEQIKSSSTAAADMTAKDMGAGCGISSSSPWDYDTVRQALERKIRKNNSGLAIDGKFLAMVGAIS